MQEQACGRNTNAAPHILTAYDAFIGIVIGHCLTIEVLERYRPTRGFRERKLALWPRMQASASPEAGTDYRSCAE